MRVSLSFMAILIVAAVGGRQAHADVVVWDTRAVPPTELVTIDSSTDTAMSVARIGAVGTAPANDMVLSPAGWLQAGFSPSFTRVELDGTGLVHRLTPGHGVADLAYDSAERLYSLTTVPSPFPFYASVVEQALDDGTFATLATLPNSLGQGMDIPRAGPLEDGFVVLVKGVPEDAGHYLYRIRRLPDGSALTEGPFGPLAELWTSGEAGGLIPPRISARHVAVRVSGESFLVSEACTNRILEFDLDGNFVRTFATLPTPVVPDPGDPRVTFRDWIRNLHVAADDTVYAAQARTVYHLAADGSLIRAAAHVFDHADAIADTEYREFASAGASCNPNSLGFWKRQCSPVRPGRRASRGVSLPSAPPLHPAMRDGRFGELQVKADRFMSRYGTTACAALWPTTPSDPRQRALMHLAATAFNLADRKLGRSCEMHVRGDLRPVSDVLAEIDTLLASTATDDWRRAAQFAAALHGGED